MSLHLRLLVTADLDAYEAVQQERLALATRYEIALDAGDELGMKRVEALAAVHEMRHPDLPPVLDDWHDGIRYDAAA